MDSPSEHIYARILILKSGSATAAPRWDCRQCVYERVREEWRERVREGENWREREREKCRARYCRASLASDETGPRCGPLRLCLLSLFLRLGHLGARSVFASLSEAVSVSLLHPARASFSIALLLFYIGMAAPILSPLPNQELPCRAVTQRLPRCRKGK